MAIDYSPIERFSKVATWNTFHGHDERRLTEALAELVEEPGFNVDDLVEHIRLHHAEPTWGWKDGEFEQVLARVYERATAVAQFVNRS